MVQTTITFKSYDGPVLKEAVDELLAQDHTLSAFPDWKAGSIVLRGYGHLHLEVATRRILKGVPDGIVISILAPEVVFEQPMAHVEVDGIEEYSTMIICCLMQRSPQDGVRTLMRTDVKRTYMARLPLCTMGGLDSSMRAISPIIRVTSRPDGHSQITHDVLLKLLKEWG